DGQADSSVATLNISITETPSLVVDTNIDNSTQYDGLTSLREAINFAASDGAATPVTFDATFFATAKTITLSSSNGPLSIFSSVDINGTAAGVTVSDGDAVKIMQVGGSGVVVNLRDLTFANGRVNAFASGSALSVLDFGGGGPHVTLIGCTLMNNGGDDTKGG